MRGAQLLEGIPKDFRCRDRQFKTQQQALEIPELLEHPRPLAGVGFETEFVESELRAPLLTAHQHAQTLGAQRRKPQLS